MENSNTQVGSTNTGSKSQKNKKVMLISAVIVIAIVIAVIVKIINSYGTDKALLDSDNENVILYYSKNEEIIIQLNNEIFNLGNGSVGDNGADFDLEKVYALIDDSQNDTEKLYLLNNKVKTEIADDVHAATISDDGSQLAYLKNMDGTNYTGTLFVHNVATAEANRITDDVLHAVLSPDGNTVMYSVFESEDKWSSYYKIGDNEPVKIGEQLILFALSNEAQYIYYAKSNDPLDKNEIGTLYVQSKNETMKLNNNIALDDHYMSDTYNDNGSSLIFNKDYTEVLVSSEEQSIYSKGMKFANKVSETGIMNIVNKNIKNKKDQRYDAASTLGIEVLTYDVAHLNDLVYRSNNKEIVIFDGKGNIKNIFDDCTSRMNDCSSNNLAIVGNDLFYNNPIMGVSGKFNVVDNVHEEVKVVNADIDDQPLFFEDFLQSKDSKITYLIDKHGIFKVGKDSKVELIFANRDAGEFIWDYYISRGTSNLYYTIYKDGKASLFVMNTIGEKKQIADDAQDIIGTPDGTLYYFRKGDQEGKFNLYRSNKEGTFDLINADIEAYGVSSSYGNSRNSQT
ncbi:TolB family protein [Cohnella abietis]|nr:hypothetical protein [Cohnella abietis]